MQNSILFSVVCDMPNFLAFLPSRGRTEHHVILDETANDLARLGQLLESPILNLVRLNITKYHPVGS
jgi:hypothetical protein